MPVGPLKDGMPDSISSTVGGKPNKLLRQDMQSQKLVLGSDKDLLKETGGKEAQKPSKYPTPFRAQNHRRVKATMKGLKKKVPVFVKRIDMALWRDTDFIKIVGRWKSRRDVYVYVDVDMYVVDM